ncbi:Nucleoside-diphosphate-sugar pyrophosphorylase involved in lipopolysaccharide biosynthesis/translation initiation factor 2B, gamma/epsilon subunits (eIF-2Bgamma/eIF-2Bepsilon) [Vibrio chagasii]|nr:Nucleoside-diphosphate-sugar pyrophosphorylase involved in lipopolysaccharide biosynthesis/translation initiation factor 2B, gamma/epsilon subunits (eIF-2Bgamma/eIF-2Bepsilon) [Vibrio chagasii]
MIVIPMAGMSSRFFKAGFDKPKYQLDAHGITLFEHSVLSFEKYFKTELFLFIVKDKFGTVEFVKSKVQSLGIDFYEIVVIEKDTRGQAESVAIGLEKFKNKPDESLTIFNIDTFRPSFNFPNVKEMEDGYLEVFIGDGDNWSFAKPKNEYSTEVIETAEKKQISQYCSTGLYFFRNIEMYMKSFDEYLKKPEVEWDKGELYIAPLYNILIKNGFKVHYNLISREDVIFCGTPEEYADFLK